MQKRRLLLAMLLCAFWLMGFAQKTVTGTVKDATGEPMIGVSVVVDGTSIGGITDADGNFSIPNVSSSAVLKVTYIGYQEQKVTVGNRSVINFVMKEVQRYYKSCRKCSFQRHCSQGFHQPGRRFARCCGRCKHHPDVKPCR